MVSQEKVPYHTKAAQRKTEYEKTLAAYKQKQVLVVIFYFLLYPECTDAHEGYVQQDEEAGDEGTPEESDKSKSEINDEEESGDVCFWRPIPCATAFLTSTAMNWIARSFF